MSKSYLNRHDAFVYGASIVIALSMSQYFDVSLSFITFGIVAMAFSFFLYKQDIAIERDEYQELDRRLTFLNGISRTEHFTLDPNVIDFFYNTREFYEYNKDAFIRAMRNADAVLAILQDADKGSKTGSASCSRDKTQDKSQDKSKHSGQLNACIANWRVAKDKYTAAMNHWHSIVFGVPSVIGAVLIKKHREATKTLQLILLQHLTTIRATCDPMKFPYEPLFTTGLSEPQAEYSKSALVPETAWNRY